MMAQDVTGSGEFERRDEDRLPWLETVDEQYEDGPSVLRVLLLVLLALAVIAAVIFGYYWFEHHRSVEGNGALIAAQEGDYKVKPADPGGLKVAGEGDSAIATSDGAGGGNASIDLKGMPEAPVPGKKAVVTPKASGASRTVTAVPVSGGKLAASTPASPPAASGGAGGTVVQLGSFPDEASANKAWAQSSKRFAYLAPLGKSVQKAQVGGRTMYRLRVAAGGPAQAAELCGKLKVAGEACYVARD